MITNQGDGNHGDTLLNWLNHRFMSRLQLGSFH